MYIYILKRCTRLEKESRFWHNEVKIGISKSPLRRLKEVDKDLAGKVIILKTWQYKEAHQLKQSLHDKYKKYNFKPRRSGKAAGKTEWFRLSYLQLRTLKANIRKTVKGRAYSNNELIFQTIFYSLLIHFILLFFK